MSLLRAVVESNNDPEALFRLRVRLPGDAEPVWALPCLPASSHSLPETGATVWATAEGGQTGRMVWLGVLPQRAP